MKALSVKQPWAWAILQGGKDVENRTWPTSYRGPLLIHAARVDSPGGWGYLDHLGLTLPVDPPTGGIIGVVDVVDCVHGYPSPWALEGYWHWVLANPRARPFRRCPGRLGLFEVRG
jgi:hypothetical protein